MRRLGLLVCVALIAGLSIGAGLSGRKFPYLSDRWNKTTELTEIELACLRGVLKAEKPLALLASLRAVEITARPTPTHIRLQVQVEPVEASSSVERMDLAEACARALAHWQAELIKKPLDPASCPITIDLSLGDKVIFRQINDKRGRRNISDPSVLDTE